MVQLQQCKNDTTTTASPKRPFFDAVIGSSNHKQQLGENGMLEYTTDGLGSELLALSQMVRGGDPKPLSRIILHESPPLTVAHLFVLMFTTRNSRGGKGEKKLAHEMFLELYKQYPKTAGELIPLFPHYGYWKDLLLIMEMGQADPLVNSNKLNEVCMNVMANQLRQDLRFLDKEYEGVPPMSLLVKWLPRENSHFDKKLKFVKTFAAKVFAEEGSNEPTAATPTTATTTTTTTTTNDGSSAWQNATSARYRKSLALLTERLKLPEVLLAAQREDEIQFGRLASKATLRLRYVLLNEAKKGGAVRSDNPKRIRLAERFIVYTLEKGLKGGQLMPHEIVAKIMSSRNMSKGEELVLDAQWKSLRESVLKLMEEGTVTKTRMVPLSDVSGSMEGVPMQVAIALGILISEITHDAYRNLVMTFESEPQWHRLHDGQTIVEKVRSLQGAPWGGSTNFEAAYDLLLSVVVENKLSSEDMPTLIVFSDMQFDEANSDYHYGSETTQQPVHERIQAKVEAVASELVWQDVPHQTMVYWNLRNTGGHPVDKATEGAVLLAGFSPSLLKLVMNGTILEETEIEIVQEYGTTKTETARVTPEQVLMAMLKDDLYNPIREIIGNSNEGKLAQVETVKEDETENGDFEMVEE